MNATAQSAATMSKAVRRAAKILGVDSATLADVLDMGEATASQLIAGIYQLQPERREYELATLFVQLFRSLVAIVSCGAEAQQWFHGSSRAFAGQRPVELIRTAEGLVRALHYLDAHAAASQPQRN